MISLYESATHLVVTADADQINELVEDFKFRPAGYFYSPLYERYRLTKGEEGWDGYVRPLQKATSTAARILRGHKQELVGLCRMHGYKVNISKLLMSPFSDLQLEDVPADLIQADFYLDDHQRLCIQRWLVAGIGVNKVTVAGGKTATYAGAAALIKSRFPDARFLYLTPAERLVKQVTREMRKFLPGWDIGQFGGGVQQHSAKDMVICTVAMLNRHYNALKGKKWFDSFLAILYDEVHHCFTAGTLVDGIPIEKIKTGDFVRSFNHSTGEVEIKRVLRVMKSRAVRLIKVKIGAFQIICTPKHPFYTVDKGYLPAVSLATGTTVMHCTTECSYTDEGNTNKMQLVSPAVFPDSKMEIRPFSGRPSSLLQTGMFKGSEKQIAIRNHVSHKSKIRIRAYAPEQSNAQHRCAFEMETIHEGLEAESSWWQWTFDSSTGVIGCCHWLASGSAGKNRVEANGWVSVGLQARCSGTEFESGHRSGWLRTQDGFGTGAGQKERRSVETARVDGIEILEFRSAEEFGKMCPDGYVYNIEVEDNHNYFVEDILVHNCGAKTSQKIVLAVPAFFRLGASDSIKEDDLARHNAIVGLFGPILNEVHAAPLMERGRLAKPHIYVVDAPEWNNRLRDVNYSPAGQSKAFVLIDGDWRRATYLGPVYEIDEKSNVKTRPVKTAEQNEDGSWATVDEPIIIQGLHRIQFEGEKEEHEVDSRWCLLDRMYDRCIIQFKPRNDLIVRWAKAYSDSGLPTLVVCTRTLHIYILEALLKAVIKPALVDILFGFDTPATRDNRFEWFRSTPGSVLVTPLVKEGVSINEIQAGVVADYVSDWEVANQIVGRFLRKKVGPDNRAHITVFRDRQHPVLRRGCNAVFERLEKIQGYTFYDPAPTPEEWLQQRAQA